MFKQIILVLFLVASYLSASHIHLDKNCDDAECEICIVIKNIQNISLDTTDISIEKIDFHESISTYLSHKHTATTYKGFFSTAPPSIL